MSTKKSLKRLKGIPVHEEELKKRRTVWLTDTAWNNAKQRAAEKGLTLGQLVEGIFRSTEGT